MNVVDMLGIHFSLGAFSAEWIPEKKMKLKNENSSIDSFTFLCWESKIRHLAECAAALKGIGHFEINFWYFLAYLKGIQDVGVFVSTVVSILIF